MTEREQVRLRAAVCRSTPDNATIVCEETLLPEQDLVLGGDASASLVVPDWSGPAIRLVTRDGLLHLAPGMRVNMCGDGGSGRIVGTYEELVAEGVSLPIAIMGRRLNVRVRAGLSVFAKYVNDRGEALDTAAVR